MARHQPSAGGPFSGAAVLAFAGMATFIGGVSVYPRLRLTTTPNTITLAYQRRQLTESGRAPVDPGVILSSGPRDEAASSSTKAANRRVWSGDDWILDTGATTHVCTDAKRMHNYTSFANRALKRSVGHFGPNPVSIAGMGEVTLDLPAPSSSTDLFGRKVATSEALGVERGFAAKGRLTIHNVSHIPSAGINIVSWSQLRRAKGLELRLKDNEDGSLGVVSWQAGEAREIMRFQLRDGLYFLEKGGKVR
jgi:hypothetical protein